MALDVSTFLALASGVALVGLGLAMLLLGRRARHAWLFGAFAVFWGCQALAGNVSKVAPALGELSVRVAMAFLLPTTVFLAHFIDAVSARPRGRRWVAWGFTAVALAGAAAFVAAPLQVLAGLNPGQPRLPQYGPAGILLVFVPFALTLDFAVLRLFVQYQRERGLARDQTRLVLAGFLVVVAYLSVRQLADLAMLPGFLASNGTPGVAFAVLQGAGVVLVAGVAAVLLRSGRNGRRDWLLVACATVPATWSATETDLRSDGLLTLDAIGVSRLIPVAIVAYGIARYHLFDIEVKLRWTFKQSSIAAAFIVVYVAASQVAALVAPETAPLVGLGAVLSLAVAVRPLQRGAERMVDRAMPLDTSPTGLNARKLEVYRVALERAMEDGVVSPDEAALLAAMRGELGITERDHAVLMHAVQRAAQPGRPTGTLAPGEVVLDRFRIGRFLGEGSFARAYLAEDLTVGRQVVLKALHPERARDPVLLGEARAMGALRHANVVTLYDVERVGEETFLVLEFVDGGSLEERLRRGRLPGREWRRLAEGLLDALEAVHGAGMLHRDVKPSNVLFTRDGRAKLADFGVASLPGAEATEGGAGPVGTARFMSPEQAAGRKLTARSDLFSAAAVLFEAHTGRPYLAAERDESAMELRMRAARAGPFRGAVEPPGLHRWFAKALDPLPERRFASARAMREALGRTVVAR